MITLQNKTTGEVRRITRAAYDRFFDNRDPRDWRAGAIRIQRKRTKGWRKTDGAIYVGRGSVFGNPFKGNADSVDRAYVTDLFLKYTKKPEQNRFVAKIKSELRGKDLMCWCPLDQPCHADVLLEIAN
jgi:uncharacterized protein DUF4326